MNLRCRLDEVLQVCPRSIDSKQQCGDLDTVHLKIYLNKKLRRCINSQWFTSSTLTTPQRFLRPRTDLPSIIKLLADPTTANGMVLCSRPSVKPIQRKNTLLLPELYHLAQLPRRHLHQYQKDRGECSHIAALP